MDPGGAKAPGAGNQILPRDRWSNGIRRQHLIQQALNETQAAAIRELVMVIQHGVKVDRRQAATLDEQVREREIGIVVEDRRVVALSLRSCGLEALPQSIAQLVDLRELDLTGNRLEALPESLGGLVRLETIWR
ncbi:MAG: hypothetical protein U0528_09900 [Anaerolineae bacterium]